VETRSGDTPAQARRRFLVNPPSILALTPESLAILLLNPRGRAVLSGVRYLILDEIHTALGTKRGAFLACQVDRLALLAGEFQRVGLSATVRSPEAAAEFVGGLRAVPGGYEKRPVRIAAPPAEKKIDFLVEFPPYSAALSGEKGGEEEKIDRYGPRYTVLVNYILERLGKTGPSETGPPEGKKTVLVFAGSRRAAERISYLVNRKAGKTLAFTHHGSLSREVRRAVETGLAEGKISCVAATSSLELGIDIGSVDEVILAGTPAAASAALQRIGRSGHGVGMVSRGRLLPFNGPDLLLAAALAGAVEDREIEETGAIENPLDILAQIILALCVEKKRHLDELYSLLRGFYPFKTLPRPSYDQVIQMLAGRLENTRMRELKGRLYLDAVTGELAAPAGTQLLLYSSGGVITNRGSYSLRLADGTKIGELDEEFVWERRLGDSFDFGSRPWIITAIGAEAVTVRPLDKGADFTPFWKADAVFRSPLLVRRLLAILDQGGLPATGGFSPAALEELKRFIDSQRKVQGQTPLGGTFFLPIEIIDEPQGSGAEPASALSYLAVLHSFRGGAVKYPLSMALAGELEDCFKIRVEAVPDDNAILLRLPRIPGTEPEKIIDLGLRRLAGGENWKKRFQERFESSGIFGAAFREAAERSLVLPRAGFGKRTPLWITRRRAKRLFDAVESLPDFPVTAEAWRSSLEDQFDMKGTAAFIRDIGEGVVGFSFFRTRTASPFARDLIWKETNVLMYQYDERPDLGTRRREPTRRGGAGLRNSPADRVSLTDRVIAEALDNAGIRPELSPDLVRDFAARLRRELSGWAPEDELSLCEWVKERIAIPLDEWESLLGVLPPALREAWELDQTLGGRIRQITREGAALPVMVHREWFKTWKEEAAALLAPWLRYEGPVSGLRIAGIFGGPPGEAEAAVELLSGEGEIIPDLNLGESGDFICDRENLEILLRISRRRARPVIKERPPSILVPCLAIRQGLLRTPPAPSPPPLEGSRGTPLPALPPDVPAEKPWEKLSGFAAQIKLWETEFFPARDPAYTGENLDQALKDGGFFWYGTRKERAGFCALPEADLVFPEEDPASSYEEETGLRAELLRKEPEFFNRPRDFWAIKEASGLDISACAKALWEEVWRGRLSSNSWEPVRRGLEEGFIPPEPGKTLPVHTGFRGRRVPRILRERWRSGPPVRGAWFSLEAEDSVPAPDPLEAEELNRDRVRLLLNRWGVLCRPLLERESPPFSWAGLLPSMRRMELAGELMAGRFFAGINSLQFASPKILEELEAAGDEKRIYWMNAADPASPAGLDIRDLDPRLPFRIPAARLCFRGPELIALTNRGGRDLKAFISPDDPGLPEALAFLKVPKTRAVLGERKISLETVNGKSAPRSEYAEALKALGFIPDRNKMILW
jgi:ATP-dependent Lhr-like helicase